MLRAPGLVLGVYLITLTMAIPFGVVMARALPDKIAGTPLANPEARMFPLEWWTTFARNTSGLAATFTPTSIGFAAPLDNLSAVADADARPLAAVGAAIAYGALWVLLWGAVLNRFVREGDRGARPFARAAFSFLGPMIKTSACALLGYALLFLLLHRLMFGSVAPWLENRAPSEAMAFAGRAGLYAVFGAALLAWSLLVDYTRVHIVAGRGRRVSEAFARATRFLRSHTRDVVTVAVLNGGLLLAALAAYAAFDLVTRGAPRAWSAILAGQLYILARLAVRLASAASQVRLFQKPS